MTEETIPTTSLVNDDHLARAEEDLRNSDFDLPVAWGLGFLIDNEELLVDILTEKGHEDKAASVRGIVDWTLFGDPIYRNEDEEEEEEDDEEN
jgi:hypothetical protein